jgi:hypothetical protein
MKPSQKPQDIIGEFRRLSAEIKTLEADRDAATQSAAHAQASLRDATAAFHQAQRVVKARFNHLSPEDIDHRLGHDPEVKRASRALDAARAADAAAQAEVDRLQAEINARWSERYALRGGELRELRPFAEAVATRRAEVDRIRERLAVVETEAAHPTAPDHLGEIDAEQARLLAATDLGEADPSALAELEKRRNAAAAKAAKAGAERDRLALLRQGLTERLGVASAALAAAHEDGLVALQRSLLAELDRLAPDFRAAAEALHACHGQLIGRAALLERLDRELGTGYSRGIGIDHLGELTIPTLRIEGLAAMPSDSHDWRREQETEALNLIRGVLGGELI